MWAAIPFILSLLVALAGAYWAFRLSRSTEHKIPWLVTSGGMLWFAILDGLWANAVIDNFTGLGLIAGLAALVAASLALTGIYLIGQRMQALEQSEGQSRQAGDFFRTIFEHLPDLVVFKDRDTLYRAANPAFQTTCALSAQAAWPGLSPPKRRSSRRWTSGLRSRACA